MLNVKQLNNIEIRRFAYILGSATHFINYDQGIRLVWQAMK